MENSGVVEQLGGLAKAGLHGRVARKKPLLTQYHKEINLKWAKDWKAWTLRDWHRTVWSNESKFNLFGFDGRTYVRRRKGEEFLPECVNQTVWRGISHDVEVYFM